MNIKISIKLVWNMQKTGLVKFIKPIEIGHEDITKITVLNIPYFTRKIKLL